MNYKTFITKIIIFICLLCSCPVYAINASDVATIDMPLAISLHPKMALYDYNRIGFYKVNLGLDDELFKENIKKLKDTPLDLNPEIEKVNNELKELNKERYDFEMTHSSSMDDEYFNTIEKYIKKEEELTNKIKDINWRMDNSDLTSREETKAIFQQIANEIQVSIKEVVEEKKYKIVINSSLVLKDNFIEYLDFTKSQGLAGMNYTLFFHFYLNRLYFNTKMKNQININSRWQELVNSVNEEKLNITNYPIVLSGGNNILNDVLKKLYKKYNVDDSVINMITSVTERVECLQQGRKIEKLEVIENE